MSKVRPDFWGTHEEHYEYIRQRYGVEQVERELEKSKKTLSKWADFLKKHKNKLLEQWSEITGKNLLRINLEDPRNRTNLRLMLQPLVNNQSNREFCLLTWTFLHILEFYGNEEERIAAQEAAIAREKERKTVGKYAREQQKRQEKKVVERLLEAGDNE